MKRYFLPFAGVLVGTLLFTHAQAGLITGDITFGGTLAADNDLSDNTAIDFNPQNAFVTSVTPGSSLDTTIDFGGFAVFQDFTFAPFLANNPLWTAGGFAFNLSSVSINTQNAAAIVLLGAGTMTGATFDDTPYDWSFSADRTQRTVAFSATNAAVPEPSTLLLFGTALVALGLWNKKRCAV